MANDKSSIVQKALAAVAVIAGIVLIFIAPERVMTSLNHAVKVSFSLLDIMTEMTGGAKEVQEIPDLLKLFYPLWTVLSMMTGVALIILAIPLSRGDYWARPLAIGFLALPIIGGTFITGSLTFIAKEIASNGAILLLAGLIPYLIFVLVDKTSVTDTVIRFFVFLLLILSAAINFVTGFGALMQNKLHAAMNPQIVDYAYTISTYATFIGLILVIVAIPLFASRLQLGLLLATVGTALMTIGSTTAYLRDSYMVFEVPIFPALIGVVALALMIVFGSRLVDHNQTSKWAILPLDKAGKAD